MSMPFTDDNEEKGDDWSESSSPFQGVSWEDILESASSSGTFAVIPEYMSHAILGIDKEHHAIALVLWPGPPTAPLRGIPCPTYLMDERAVVLMIARLQTILKELRTLPFPPSSPSHDDLEDETHS